VGRLEALKKMKSTGGITVVSLNSGIGYAVNDTGIILGGDNNAVYIVTSVEPSTGAVLGVTIGTPGTSYTPTLAAPTRAGAPPPFSQPGVGIGLRINIDGVG